MTCGIHIFDTAALSVMQTLGTKLQRVYITTPTRSIFLYYYYYKSHTSFVIAVEDQGVVRKIGIESAQPQLFIHQPNSLFL